jgi:RHS repeat-associated protein
MVIIKRILLILVIVFYVNVTVAEENEERDPTYVIAPQNFISDFPNEQLSIQALNVAMVYNDVLIPGNEGMDISITRRMGGSKITFDRITLSTSYSYAADDTVFNLSCLGDFQDLTISINGNRLTATGYNSSSEIPDSGFAFFSNGSYFKCEGSTPTLHFSNGEKHTFTQVNQDSTSYYLNKTYYVNVFTNRHGNSITYGYKDDVLIEAMNAPMLLKTITRDDGQVVNFIYDQLVNSYTRSSVIEINYSGRKIEYKYNGDGTLDKFIDAEGHETSYTYGLYTGIGNQISSVTIPEGLVVNYQFGAYTVGMGMRPWGDDHTGSGGQLISKSVSGPGIDTRWYSYAFGNSTEGGNKTLVVHKDYKNELDLTTEYTIKSGRLRNWVGQIIKVRGFEGEFSTNGNIRSEYGGHNKLYELTNTWKQINNGSVGCHRSTDIPIFDVLDCSRYEISNIELKIKNTNDFDTFTTDISLFNIYGKPLTTTESFSTNSKVTSQSYEHDVDKWILNQRLVTQVGKTVGALKNVTEFTYYAKDHEDFPFLLNETKSFGVWQKKNSDYHSDGSLKRIEYNQKLSFGDKTSNRYQIFSAYNRGIPQEITTPNRLSVGTMIKYQEVDDFGQLISSTDYNGNVVSQGYDNIGRLIYVNPADVKVADTFITWSYDGTGNHKAKKTVSKCTLNATFTACSDTEKLTTVTFYDGFLNPLKIATTDIANSKTIYQNFTYNNLDKLIFASFSSLSSTENKGVNTHYDALQRLISTQHSGGGTIKREYLLGNKIRVTDAEDNITTTTYLAYGSPDYQQATKISSPESVTTDIAVNILGNIESITQSGFNGTTPISQTEYHAYDNQQRLCQLSRNDVGTTVIKRNAYGEIIWQAQGQTANSNNACNTVASAEDKVSFNYDNLGYKRSISYGDGTSFRTFTYDDNGNIKTITGQGFSQNYNYNSLNLLEDETLNIAGRAASLTLDYGYNSLGHLSSLKYPDGEAKVNFETNAFGQATQAIRTYADSTVDYFVKGGTHKATYYPNGMLNSFIYGNGVVHKTTLNSRNLPENLTDKLAADDRMNFTYDYDNNNNITKIINTRDAGVYSLQSLTYDGLDRLKTTTGSDGIGDTTLTYDGLGNIRTYKNTSLFDAHDLTYSYNNNRLSSVSGTGQDISNYDFKQKSSSSGDNYDSYDSRGNIKHNGKRSFTYNLANQMTRSGSNSYVYDGYDRRIKTTDSKGTSFSMYSQAGQLLYRETSKGGINYIFLGSKLIAEEGAGVVISDSIMNYKPFGDSIEEPKDDVGYTGHKFDTDLGLSYMQARYYDPVIGRFYSNDPIGFRDIHSFNRYAYANNNPYKYTDPDGKESKERGAGFRVLAAVILDALGAVSPETSQAMINDATGTKGARGNSKKSAMTSLKKDAKIPRSQSPEKVEKVKMTDGNGNTAKTAEGKVVNTTEYTHTTTGGDKVVIQNHSAGHDKGNVGPHLNVRPAENTKTGKVEGTKAHYEFDN